MFNEDASETAMKRGFQPCETGHHVVQFVADVRDGFMPREDCGIVGAQVALDADE